MAILLGQPVNWQHPLNKDLAFWYRGISGKFSSLSSFSLTNRCNGTLTSGASWTGPFAPSKSVSMSFDNTDDYVEVADLPRGILTDSPGFAMSGWICPQTIDSSWHTVLTKYDAASNRQIFLAVNGGYSATTNGLTLFTNSLGNGAVGTAALTAGRWYFFLASHYGTGAGGNALWIYSRESGWETATPGGAAPSSTGIDTDSGGNPVRLSRYTDGSPLAFSGYMADTRFYTSARHDFSYAQAELYESLRGYPSLLNRTRNSFITTVSAPPATDPVKQYLVHSQAVNRAAFY